MINVQEMTSYATIPDCILLNGPSSAGKTSLALELQERLPVVFLYFGIDAVLYSLPKSDIKSMMDGHPIHRAEYCYENMEGGLYNAIKGMLQAQNRLIVDNALITQKQRSAFNSAVQSYRTLRVGVFCDFDELARREVTRGDRALGTAAAEAAKVHVGMDYDLIVDTTTLKTLSAVEEITEFLGLQ